MKPCIFCGRPGTYFKDLNDIVCEACRRKIMEYREAKDLIQEVIDKNST
jgi:DNA-directed RNA polymerase subunit RPC12/RpoP